MDNRERAPSRFEQGNKRVPGLSTESRRCCRRRTAGRSQLTPDEWLKKHNTHSHVQAARTCQRIPQVHRLCAPRCGQAARGGLGGRHSRVPTARGVDVPTCVSAAAALHQSQGGPCWPAQASATPASSHLPDAQDLWHKSRQLPYMIQFPRSRVCNSTTKAAHQHQSYRSSPS